MATNNRLKRTLLALLTLFALVGVITIGIAAKANRTYGAGKQDFWDNLAPQRCSQGTLRGAYALMGQGTVLMPAPPGAPLTVPISAVEYWVFDGAGNSQSTSTLVFNGTAFKGNPPLNATYTVNENCTGALKLGDATGTYTIDFVITDGGKEFFWIQSEPAANLCGTAKRIKNTP